MPLPHTVTPPSASAIVLGCFGDSALADTLEQLCGGLARVVRIDDRLALSQRGIHATPSLVILPLVDAEGTPSSPLVARLAAQDVVVAVCIPPRAPTRGLAEALRAGARLLSWTTTDELRAQIEPLLDHSAMSEEERAALDDTLRELGPLPLRALLAQCAVHAHQRLDVGMLAGRVGMSARTLNRATQRAGWPPPGELIAWGRVLRAGLARWSGVESPAALARAAGFASVAAMAATIRDRLAVCADLHELTPLRISRAFHRRLARRASLTA